MMEFDAEDRKPGQYAARELLAEFAREEPELPPATTLSELMDNKLVLRTLLSRLPSKAVAALGVTCMSGRDLVLEPLTTDPGRIMEHLLAATGGDREGALAGLFHPSLSQLAARGALELPASAPVLAEAAKHLVTTRPAIEQGGSAVVDWGLVSRTTLAMYDSGAPLAAEKLAVLLDGPRVDVWLLRAYYTAVGKHRLKYAQVEEASNVLAVAAQVVEGEVSLADLEAQRKVLGCSPGTISAAAADATAKLEGPLAARNAAVARVREVPVVQATVATWTGPSQVLRHALLEASVQPLRLQHRPQSPQPQAPQPQGQAQAQQQQQGLQQQGQPQGQAQQPQALQPQALQPQQQGQVLQVQPQPQQQQSQHQQPQPQAPQQQGQGRPQAEQPQAPQLHQRQQEALQLLPGPVPVAWPIPKPRSRADQVAGLQALLDLCATPEAYTAVAQALCNAVMAGRLLPALVLAASGKVPPEVLPRIKAAITSQAAAGNVNARTLHAVLSELDGLLSGLQVNSGWFEHSLIALDAQPTNMKRLALALCVATAHGSGAAAKLLLERGAGAFVTAAQVAAMLPRNRGQNGRMPPVPPLMKQLLSHCAGGDSPEWQHVLGVAVGHGDTPLVWLLRVYGVTCTKGTFSKLLLGDAVRAGQVEEAQLLLQHGAGQGARAELQRLLAYAFHKRSPRMVELLLQHGAGQGAPAYLQVLLGCAVHARVSRMVELLLTAYVAEAGDQAQLSEFLDTYTEVDGELSLEQSAEPWMELSMAQLMAQPVAQPVAQPKEHSVEQSVRLLLQHGAAAGREVAVFWRAFETCRGCCVLHAVTEHSLNQLGAGVDAALIAEAVARAAAEGNVRPRRLMVLQWHDARLRGVEVEPLPDLSLTTREQIIFEGQYSFSALLASMAGRRL